MIQLTVLAICDSFLLGLLIYKQEYLIFQTMLVSQIFLILLLLPFHIRGETSFDKNSTKPMAAMIVALLGAIVAALVFASEEPWKLPSNFNDDVHLLVSEYADLLAIVAVAMMGVALSATSFLRGRE